VTITILTEDELRRCVPLDEAAVDVVADAFSALAGGDVVMPPILRLDVTERNGELDVKTAYVPGLESFAVKMSSGFFDNPKRGLPSLSGLMILFSAETGRVEAVLLDNGYLTDLRTAAAGAVAARHLAPRGCRTVGVIGAGVQARLQAQALTLVRDVARLLVWARDPAKATDYAADMGRRLGLAVEVAASPAALVRASDAVITATPARTPIVEADWLHPGLHITAMGADAEHKGELHPDVLARADRLVCDSRSQCLRLGELRRAVEVGAVDRAAPVVELGQVTSGAAPGRESETEITVCDLTGTGVQDTAIAVHARRRALAGRLGTTV
jgi:ornithine cyclodeaminase